MNFSNDLILKFFKFGVVGVSGIVVDFGITYLLKEKSRANKYLANSGGFCCAVVTNFILNRIWTFQSHDPAVGIQFAKFCGIAVVGLAMNNGIIYLLTEKRGLPFYWAKLIATGIVVLWNFGANMAFTF